MALLVALATTLAALLASSPQPRVVVVGGTHGNEFTGIHVVEQLQREMAAVHAAYPSLAVETMIANPRAYAANSRFVDDDLNRQFAGRRPSGSYEAQRATEIEASVGPKGSEDAVDVVIDLHTTTANMGLTIIVNSYCSLALRMAAYLSEVWTASDDSAGCDADGADAPARAPPLPASSHPLRVYLHDVTQTAAPYLCSIGKAGITIEVGPTPQGLPRADVVATTQRALGLMLRYLERFYSGRPPPAPPSLRVYLDRGKVAWPEPPDGSALPGALIAPSLQDRDFEPLHAGEPMFVRLDGTVVPYDGASGDVVYPIFVNEAAYYYAQSGRGVGLTTPADWPLG